MVADTRESGRMGKDMEKARITLSMGTNMLVIGSMTT
jgi:hypothetical protein